MEYKTKHPLYNKWRSMMHRCYNKKMTNYMYYGGRGISVCERWHDFWTFAKDIKEIPSGYSLDRIDVNGNYEPTNVRIADSHTQATNKRFREDGNIIFKNGSWQACVRVYGAKTAFYKFKEKSHAVAWRATAILSARAGQEIAPPSKDLLISRKTPSGTVYVDQRGLIRAMVRVSGERLRCKSFSSIQEGKDWCKKIVKEIYGDTASN